MDTIRRRRCTITGTSPTLRFPLHRHDVHTRAFQRHAWYPYFDDINALIFLAPISCFDERLAEDRRVNRLQDSLLIWKAVCSSQLLAKVQLILVRPSVQIALKL